MISPIAIVKLIREQLTSQHPDVLRALLDICPRTLDDENWRWELSGFVSALTALRQLQDGAEPVIQRALFPEIDEHQRKKTRSKNFSIDIYTLSASLEARKFQYDVPALNPFDAYAKLAMRGSYNRLDNVDVVQVFRGNRSEREHHQTPLRSFSREEIVQPRG
jgi:hypothetical protein